MIDKKLIIILVFGIVMLLGMGAYFGYTTGQDSQLKHISELNVQIQNTQVKYDKEFSRYIDGKCQQTIIYNYTRLGVSVDLPSGFIGDVGEHQTIYSYDSDLMCQNIKNSCKSAPSVNFTCVYNYPNCDCIQSLIIV